MNDKTILRELAKKYIDICLAADQDEKRDLWRKHNSFNSNAVPIYVRAFAWHEMPESKCECDDEFFHPYESFLRQSIFRAAFEDDFIFEPWLTVNAEWITPFQEEWGGIWGMPVKWIGSNDPNGSKRWDSPLKKPEDIGKLKVPKHRIDEKKTQDRMSRLSDVFGDILTLNLDRGPVFRMWNGDISTQLIQLRGLEQVMWDMTDRPQWLHELLAFMRDGILKTHQEAEQAGDWSLSDHQNQAMPYAGELSDPAANTYGVKRKQLWYFCAAQELTLVGPEMFNDFMLQYQLPVMEPFGLIAYGCCEDLTQKIDYLRKIPNLRRIAVSPFADVAKCAEKIGRDYIISYRPSPADMVSYGFDEDRISSILRRDLAACKGCYVDITLKDVETVQKDPNRIKKWVNIVRKISEEFVK